MDTQTEMNAVFATAHNGRAFRVSDPLSWDAAQSEWRKLDEMHRAGRLPHVKFFEVRTVFLGPDRPLVGPKVTSHGRYDGALVDLLYATPVVSGSRGFANVEDAARAAWRAAFPSYRTPYDRRNGLPASGTQGVGGWFFWPNGHTAAQGLRGLAAVVQNRRMVVQGGDGRWYLTAPEMPNPEAREEVAV